ncbi:Y-family DNA polymerase [Segetibacter sp. 3557_3]|uniref:Y-family DNA polymerase n=1 Tax=Segetibacter sp. 3557_3 TaxID=2547429 RepID=UPI0010583CE3|nr:Y-family DNA polymerase [Segetibacter sp. 3557_3]TDH28777.1 Y-family DNA polymerase [Segetibacter sp. 3557_3]
MYALVDCNNFYCSCERLFNPMLEGKPVIVLSNNDGCAIARSEEAKALGISMGTPAFMIREIVKNHDVKVFSSNYTLYGDMSDRVMQTLAGFVSRLEIYSIDEAFLDMHNMEHTNLLKLGIQIRRTVIKNTGIPVCVGIAPTKTLAKMANRYAKKRWREVGVHWAANQDLIDEMLAATEVGNIWGIGHQYALFLKTNGFKTALDFVGAPEEWVRVNMSVVGQRLYNELKGIPAIKWQFEARTKKNICTSRSFGSLLTDKALILEAACNYTANCALKLRQQNSCAREVIFFLQTNPHRTEDKQYMMSIKLKLESATNNTPELIKYVSKGFELIYKPGFNYLKCGVIVDSLVPESEVQYSMFSDVDDGKTKRVNSAIDSINRNIGKETVRFAVQGFEKKYRLKAEMLSHRYSTNINELIKVTR